MSKAEVIERRANPYAKQLLLVALCEITLFILVYYTRLLVFLRILFAYLAPLILIYGLVVAIALYRQGTSNLPTVPLVIGTILVVGGAFFDMIATVIKSPALERETNRIARALLDSGHSIGFVYVYGLAAQILFMVLTCVLWTAFLRHRETIIASTKNANPKSYLQFVKAATGGGHLSWRQYLLPLKPSEFPKSYHLVWFIPLMWVGMSPYRWYLGLEWLNLAFGSRTAIIAILYLLPPVVYLAWLWIEYSNRLNKEPSEA